MAWSERSATNFGPAHHRATVPPTRRDLLALAAGASGGALAAPGAAVGAGVTVATAGCVQNPGRACPGATVRLSLTRVEAVDDPIALDGLSIEGTAVVETAVDGEHVEHCVTWEPGDDETGPSSGLREVGERIEADTGVELADRSDDVVVEATYEGGSYRLELRIERGE